MRAVFVFIILLISPVLWSKSLLPNNGGYVIENSYASDVVPDGCFILRGVVKDKLTEEPLIGAAITNFDKSEGVVSDVDGFFNMEFCHSDSALIVYYMNYETITIAKKDLKNRHIITVKIQLNESPIMTLKPVVYAYSAPQEVELSIQPKGEFTFIYPQMKNDQWNFTTTEDGNILLGETENRYPYLFYESVNKNLTLQETEIGLEGYLVKTDTLISFLEETLNAYGLNSREATDFITYWAPKMVEKPYALLQFRTNEWYSAEVASISISPQPESLIRLYMLYVPMETPEFNKTILVPTVTAFKRSGFTIVEWGGSVIPLNSVIFN